MVDGPETTRAQMSKHPILIITSSVIMLFVALLLLDHFGRCRIQGNETTEAAEPSTQPITVNDFARSALRQIDSGPTTRLARTVHVNANAAGTVKSIKIKSEDALAAEQGTKWADIIEALTKLFWAAVAVVVVFYVFSGRAKEHLKDIARNVKSVEFEHFGKIDFRSENAARLRQTAERTFAAYRLDVRIKFNEELEKHHVPGLLIKLLERIRGELGGGALPKGFRCTVHVPDPLFADTFYQLTNYQPADAENSAGRTKSTRFGIIGRAWREDKSLAENVEEAVLVADFGMKKPETDVHARSRRSFAAILLRNSTKQKVGLLYMDAIPTNAFVPPGTTEPGDFVSIMENLCELVGLSPAVALVVEAVRGPQIRVHDE